MKSDQPGLSLIGFDCREEKEKLGLVLLKQKMWSVQEECREMLSGCAFSGIIP